MDETGRDLQERVLRPRFRAEVVDLAAARYFWRKLANGAEAFSHVLLAAATIASFASGFFPSPFVAFAAGGLIIVATALRNFSAYANRESSERNHVLARVLGTAGVPPLPDLVADPDDRGGPLSPVARGGPPADGGARPPRSGEGGPGVPATPAPRLAAPPFFAPPRGEGAPPPLAAALAAALARGPEGCAAGAE